MDWSLLCRQEDPEFQNGVEHHVQSQGGFRLIRRDREDLTRTQGDDNHLQPNKRVGDEKSSMFSQFQADSCSKGHYPNFSSDFIFHVARALIVHTG